MADEGQGSTALMTNSTRLAIDRAMMAAAEKHGPLTADPVRACAILGREWGEAMNEALLMTVPGASASKMPGPDRMTVASNRRTLMFLELAQVAGTAIYIMENLMKAEKEHINT